MAGLKRHLDAGFDQVTPAVCQGLIQKVRDQEDQYLQEDEEDDNREQFDDFALRANESGFPEAEENPLERIVDEQL
jgi:hypothetical protein